MESNLGDNFANISDLVAGLSTDYDGIIQADSNYKTEIEKIKNEKVKLLETNNNLFTQITNSKKENTDPNQSTNPFDNNQNNTNNTNTNEKPNIDSIINDSGNLE